MNPRIWPPVVDWTSGKHWDFEAAAVDAPRPCVLCGKPSLLLSDDGKPCHKVCAEGWFEQHPQAWAAYEEKRDEAKKKKKKRAAATAPVAGVDDNALFDKAA